MRPELSLEGQVGGRVCWGEGVRVCRQAVPHPSLGPTGPLPTFFSPLQLSLMEIQQYRRHQNSNNNNNNVCHWSPFC